MIDAVFGEAKFAARRIQTLRLLDDEKFSASSCVQSGVEFHFGGIFDLFQLFHGLQVVLGRTCIRKRKLLLYVHVWFSKEACALFCEGWFARTDTHLGFACAEEGRGGVLRQGSLGRVSSQLGTTNV